MVADRMEGVEMRAAVVEEEEEGGEGGDGRMRDRNNDYNNNNFNNSEGEKKKKKKEDQLQEEGRRNGNPGVEAACGSSGGGVGGSQTTNGKKIKFARDVKCPDTLIDKKSGRTFTRGKMLGKGGFATCYALHETTHNEVKATTDNGCSDDGNTTASCGLAAKVVNKAILQHPRMKAKLIAEIRIHRSLRHDNIVAFNSVFEDEKNVYILLERCQSVTLAGLLRRKKRMREDECAAYLVQIMSALHYLHNRHVVHRDLKLSNILLSTSDGSVKLGDFGLACKMENDEDRKTTICGTPNYIAPEVLAGKSIGHSYEVDIWSVGVIAYTLLLGRPPFESSEVKTTYRRIRSNTYEFPEDIAITDIAKNFIQSALQPSPVERASLDELQYHPFIYNTRVNDEHPPVEIQCPQTGTSAKFANKETHMTSSTDQEVETALHEDRRSKNENTPKESSNEPIHSIDNRNHTNCDQSLSHSSTKEGKVYEIDGKVIQGVDVPLTDSTNFSHKKLNQSPNVNRLQSNVSCTKENLRETIPQESATSLTPKSIQVRDDVPQLTRVVNSRPSGSSFNMTWVTRWLDYSSKYGLGYKISNGCVGVLFNDATKIVQSADRSQYEYIGKMKASSPTSPLADPIVEVYRGYVGDPVPQDLKKKVALLRHFNDYFEKESDHDTINDQSSMSQTKSMIFVKKWITTRHAIVFRISNHSIQVNFNDGAKLLLSSEEKIVSYIDLAQERHVHSLGQLPDDKDLLQRLKYAKLILHQFVSRSRSPR